MHRSLIVLAGLFGAAGVAVSAGGSHGAGDNLAIAGSFLLLHAPALLALAQMRTSRLAAVAGCVLAAGLVLFAGDLVMRARTGMPLLAFAAPVGGGLLILGWLTVAAVALVQHRS